MDDEKRPPKTKRKLPRRISEGYLRNSSLYYLQRHPASVSHFLTVMTRKMKRSDKAHPGQDSSVFEIFLKETLVPELIRAGFLNDELYAKALTHSLQRRGLPKRTITMRLATKGVEPDAEVLAEQDDLSAAVLFAKRKRLGPFAKVAREPQKDLAALARAGFSYDVALKIIKGNLEDLLNAG